MSKKTKRIKYKRKRRTIRKFFGGNKIKSLIKRFEELNCKESFCMQSAENIIQHLDVINNIGVQKTLNPQEYMDAINTWNIYVSNLPDEIYIHKIDIVIRGRVEISTRRIFTNYLTHSFILIQQTDKFYFGDAWQGLHLFNFRKAKVFSLKNVTDLLRAPINGDLNVLDMFFNDDNNTNWIINRIDDGHMTDTYDKNKILPDMDKYGNVKYTIVMSTFVP